MNRQSLVFAATWMAAVIAHQARAESSVSLVQWESAEWKFVPAISESGTRVDSIVALRTSGVAGDNISAVWFKRGTTTWRVVAWEEQDLGKVIKAVKTEFGIPDRYDNRWPVAPGATAAAAPEGFANGVLDSDPMRVAIEQSSDPKAYLETLVSSGWKAALLQFEIVDLSAGCDQVPVFELYAEGVEMEISAAFPDGAGVAHIAAQRAGTCATPWCWENDWTVSGPTLVGCTNNGWVPRVGVGLLGPGPFWLGGTQCSETCWFQTSQTCTWTKTKMHENWDCTSCQYTQTGSCTVTIVDTSVEFFPNCVEPAGYVCPPTGPDDGGDQPNACTPSGWTGSPPCD